MKIEERAKNITVGELNEISIRYKKDAGMEDPDAPYVKRAIFLLGWAEMNPIKTNLDVLKEKLAKFDAREMADWFNHWEVNNKYYENPNNVKWLESEVDNDDI